MHGPPRSCVGACGCVLARHGARCVSWDVNPSPAPSWGTNLRGGTTCFVACREQSVSAHYIYSTLCSHWWDALNSQTVPPPPHPPLQWNSCLLLQVDAYQAARCTKPPTQQLCRCVGAPEMTVNNSLFRGGCSAPPPCPLPLSPPPSPTLVLCPGPPVLSLFCLGTGGCQSGFMSSSLELKEVSFMSCYGTRRLWPSEVMRSGPGEPPRSERDRPSEATSSEEVKAAFVPLQSAACLVITPPPHPLTSQPSPGARTGLPGETPRLGRPTGE